MSIPNVYALSFYDANRKLNLKITNNSNSVIYNDVEYDSLEALYNQGITTYPTLPLLCFKDEILTLYDENTGLYFDRRQNLNQWVNKNPTEYYQQPSIQNDTTTIFDSNLIDNKISLINDELLINHHPYYDTEQQIAYIRFINSIKDMTDLESIETFHLDEMGLDHDYDKEFFVYVQEVGGETINGVSYNFGDSLSVLLLRRTLNYQEVFYYRSLALFNDENNHSEQEYNSAMSLYNLLTFSPVGIVVGYTEELPSEFNSMPQTHWWWCGGFGSGTSTNWYNPANYATSSVPAADSSFVTISNSTKYKDCVISNGTSIFTPTTLKLADYSSKPEFYLDGGDNSFTRSATNTLNNIVVLHNKNNVATVWSLPSDLYTLNGRNITWNTSSQFYMAFEHKNIALDL